MSSIQELSAVGRGLGIEREALLEERLKLAQLQAENDRADREAQKLELAKLARVAEREERDRVLEKDKIELQLSMEKLQYDCKMQELQNDRDIKLAKAEMRPPEGGDRISIEQCRIKGPKLPCFEETKDCIDAYLFRFEKYAELQKWNRDMWGIQLSSLLKGKALEVYSRLPAEQSLSYDSLAAALLKRFEVTEEALRKKVRDSKPERGETYEQFGERLKSYHNKWLDLGKVEPSFNNLQDFLLRDQFLQTCGKDLATFLKERDLVNFVEMTRQADRYAENRGGAFNVVSRGFRGQDNQRLSKNLVSQPLQTNRNTGRPGELLCFACGRKGHIARDCPGRHRGASAMGQEVGEYYQQFDTMETHLGDRGNGFGPQVRGRGRGNETVSRGRGWDNGSHRGRGQSWDYSRRGRGGVMGACILARGILGGTASGHTMGGLVIKAGFVNGRLVNVVSDSGCNGIVVKRDLVYNDQMLDKVIECRMINGQIIAVPVARIHIDTPYLQGTVEAWVMDSPVYDLIVGQVPPVVETAVSRSPDKGETVDRRVGEAVTQAVVTREQYTQRQKESPQVKVPDTTGLNKTTEEIRGLQGKDNTLDRCRDNIRYKVVKQTRSGAISWTYIEGTLYRQFQCRDGQKHYQLVVPQILRIEIMKLGHETMMVGHLGTRKTINKIISDFYWPGCEIEIRRFCQSCRSCPLTTLNERVRKVRRGRITLRDTPIRQVEVGPIKDKEPVIAGAVEKVSGEDEKEIPAGTAEFVSVIEKPESDTQEEVTVDVEHSLGEQGPTACQLVVKASCTDVVVSEDLAQEQKQRVHILVSDISDLVTDRPDKIYKMELKVETPEPVCSSRSYPHIRELIESEIDL